MATIDEKCAVLQESFLTEGVKKHLKQLLETDEEVRKRYYRYSKERTHVLFDKARELLARAEAGEFTDEQMEEVEEVIALLLAAINLPQPEIEKEPGQN